MLQAIVLDFDGVIANSEPLHLRAFQEVLAAGGHSLSAQEYYARYVGLDDAGMFAAFAADHGVPAGDRWVQDLIRAKTTRMQHLLRDGTLLFPGVVDRIKELAAMVPVAIASGALRHEIVLVLDEAGIAGCFRAIVAAGETPRGKPAPDPYARAVELLGQFTGSRLDPARVVAVEDTTQGLASARAAGLRTVGVTTTYPAQALSSADAVVPMLSEVTIPLLASIVANGGDGTLPAKPR